MTRLNFLIVLLSAMALLLGPTAQVNSLPVVRETSPGANSRSDESSSSKSASSSTSSSSSSSSSEAEKRPGGGEVAMPVFPSSPMTSASSASSASSAVSPSRPDGWRDVLKKMTEEKPCGGEETYELCRQCGQLTGNKDAFYWCCLNTDDVRGFCESFVNYTIE